MKPETKHVAQAVGAAVAGATLGYVAGVLSAPAKGSETRQRIGRTVETGVEDISKKAKATVKDAKATMAKALSR